MRDHMATEFELSFKGSSRNMLDAISVLAEHNVNLETVATAKVEDTWVIKFVTGSEEEVRRSFMKADLHFNEKPVMVVEMHNKPGQWLKVARALNEAGIEINASYLLSQHGDTQRFVFGVSDREKASKVCRVLSECSVD